MLVKSNKEYGEHSTMHNGFTWRNLAIHSSLSLILIKKLTNYKVAQLKVTQTLQVVQNNYTKWRITALILRLEYAQISNYYLCPVKWPQIVDNLIKIYQAYSKRFSTNIL